MKRSGYARVAPVAKPKFQWVQLHGHTKTDDYAWFKTTEWLSFMHGDNDLLPEILSI